MGERMILLLPELVLFAGAVLAAILGLSASRTWRDRLPAVAALFLLGSLVATALVHTDARVAAVSSDFLLPGIGRYVKAVVAIVGIALAAAGAGIGDRRLEADLRDGKLPFDPLRTSRGEYWAFFLLSLMGVMLCAGARDLIWLFVALELTSLPTYIMVAIGRPQRKAQEAAMKYFFLGALASATFLYGFALLYGATGTIVLSEMRDVFAALKISGAGSIGALGTVGAILAMMGLAYKIAAAPMHFYAADVYEGAASPVTAFLGFVPKAAGMIGLILLLAAIGWGDAAGFEPGLPQPIVTVLWMVAVLTMTLGNVGALLQRSVKRMLAYSSIAHSGYMMIGLIAGTPAGIRAVLFYLLVYGLMNTGAFAVLSGLERRGREIESVDDLAGLRQRHPAMAWSMALCAGSLLGFPPLLGFVAKLLLFIAGVQAGQVALVVIAGLNSAISAWYYLRLVAVPTLAGTTALGETVERAPSEWPRRVAVAIAVAVVVLPIFAARLIDASDRAVAGPAIAASEPIEAPRIAQRTEEP